MLQRKLLTLSPVFGVMTVLVSFAYFSPSCAQRENPNRSMALTNSITNPNATVAEKITGNENLDTATFGTGCFWCTEAIFLELRGVERVDQLQNFVARAGIEVSGRLIGEDEQGIVDQ